MSISKYVYTIRRISVRVVLYYCCTHGQVRLLFRDVVVPGIRGIGTYNAEWRFFLVFFFLISLSVRYVHTNMSKNYTRDRYNRR